MGATCGPDIDPAIHTCIYIYIYISIVHCSLPCAASCINAHSIGGMPRSSAGRLVDDTAP